MNIGQTTKGGVSSSMMGDYKAKIEKGTSQRPLTNQLHKRNSSSVQNNSDSLYQDNSDSQLAQAHLRMTSPPGKQ